MLWSLRRVEEGWRLSPKLPVAAWWVPELPVSLDGVGSVDGGPVDGGGLVGRLVPGPDGWHVRMACAVGRLPSDDAIAAAWARMVASEQATNPIVRREDVLRRAGHHLMRVAHVAAWGAFGGG